MHNPLKVQFKLCLKVSRHRRSIKLHVVYVKPRIVWNAFTAVVLECVYLKIHKIKKDYVNAKART